MKYNRSNIAGILNSFFATIIIVSILSHGLLDVILFKTLEYKYKQDVKQIIKSEIPHEKLEIFVFHKNIMNEEFPGFKWMKKNEFRFKGEMYDIIKQEPVEDSIYFYCFHDVKESGLYAELDKKVSNYISGNPEQKNKIKSIFNLINKYYEEGRVIASTNTYQVKLDYPAPYQENELNRYISIHLPPPKYKVST